MRKKVNAITQTKINELKRSKKYISEVFVELNNSKEHLRYFFYRKKWKHRIISDFNALFNDYYGQILKEAFSDTDIKFNIFKRTSVSNLIRIIDNTNKFLIKLHNKEIDFPNKYTNSLLTFQIFSNKYEEPLNELIYKSKIISSRYMLVTGSAGNGKTNLLCNFSEMIIAQKAKCVFLNAKEVNDNIEDHFLKQFGIPKYFEKKEIIRFIFEKIIIIKNFFGFSPLYVIIDAVNENNKKEFLKNLPIFINKLLKQKRVFIIISCRSEYFETRFKKALIDDITVQPICENIIETKYTKEAMDRLFKVYGKTFNYTVKLQDAIKDCLCQQLLLTRIFFETYGGTNEQINDLNVYKLFSKYISKIQSEKEVNVEEYLDEIVYLMLKNNDYSSVSISLIKNSSLAVQEAIDGTVLVSKTILRRPNSITSDEEERVQFVFDEMRDYCIARYKLKELCKKKSGAEYEDAAYKFIKDLSKENALCLEGVISYVYREGQMNSWDKTCEALLKNEIRQLDENSMYNRRMKKLNLGLRLIFNNPNELLKCEKNYISCIMNDCNSEMLPLMFSYLIKQELTSGRNTLDVYLEGLKYVKNISETLKSSFGTWQSDFVGIGDLQMIDIQIENLNNQSIMRFRKLEALCLILLNWHRKKEFFDYFKNKISNFDVYINGILLEYKLEDKNDFNN